MSNESSASETTPLRRPESQQLIEQQLIITTTRNVANNNSSNSGAIAIETPITPTSSRNVIITTAAAPSPPANINNNNNNNYNSETRLGHHQVHNLDNNINNNNYNNNNNNNNDNIVKMDMNKRMLLRVGIDTLILLCVGFPILFFFLWGDSYKRGFFCDDESLKHPFKDSTVRNWMLYIIGLVLPVGVIFTVEFIRSRDNARKSNGNNVAARRYVFMDFEIPDWLVECYKKIGVFGFGAAVSQLTTDIAKYSIGRLRPHFFAVCQPIMADGTTCADVTNAGKYIQDFKCQGFGSTERMLKEVRLSFPSGHSSFTFYTMVYVALYLQARMTWRGSKLFCHFLQFLFIMIAWYTALSRVSDYKHHWSDVLAGSSIGALIAVIVAKYVSDLFQPQLAKLYLPRTTQDVTAQTITTTN